MLELRSLFSPQALQYWCRYRVAMGASENDLRSPRLAPGGPPPGSRLAVRLGGVALRRHAMAPAEGQLTYIERCRNLPRRYIDVIAQAIIVALERKVTLLLIS